MQQAPSKRLTVYIKTIYFIATVTEEMHLGSSLSKLILLSALEFYSLSTTNLHLQSENDFFLTVKWFFRVNVYIVLTKTLKIPRRRELRRFFCHKVKVFSSRNTVKLSYQTSKVTVAITPYFSLLIVDLSSYFIFMHYAY